MKNTIFFYMCLTLPISRWHLTRLSRHSVGLINEQQSLRHSRSFVGIFRIMAAKTLKKFVSLTDSHVQTFLEGEENQTTKRKTESCLFSGFSNDISRRWERKSTTSRFATGWFWPCIWKISFVGKDQSDNWEFCTLKIRPIVCFWSDSTHVFILSASRHVFILSASTHFMIIFYSLLCRSFYFHELMKSTFLVSKGLLCL